jgi:hypothetical protein
MERSQEKLQMSRLRIGVLLIAAMSLVLVSGCKSGDETTESTPPASGTTPPAAGSTSDTAGAMSPTAGGTSGAATSGAATSGAATAGDATTGK